MNSPTCHKEVVCVSVSEAPRRPTSAAVSKVSLNETRAKEFDPLSCLRPACIVCSMDFL